MLKISVKVVEINDVAFFDISTLLQIPPLFLLRSYWSGDTSINGGDN
jgi:hypothetical protein